MIYTIVRLYYDIFDPAISLLRTQDRFTHTNVNWSVQKVIHFSIACCRNKLKRTETSMGREQVKLSHICTIEQHFSNFLVSGPCDTFINYWGTQIALVYRYHIYQCLSLEIRT